jgi:hypothetical protein
MYNRGRNESTQSLRENPIRSARLATAAGVKDAEEKIEDEAQNQIRFNVVTKKTYNCPKDASFRFEIEISNVEFHSAVSLFWIPECRFNFIAVDGFHRLNFLLQESVESG